VDKDLIGTWVIDNPSSGGRTERVHREDGTYSYRAPDGTSTDGTYFTSGDTMTFSNQQVKNNSVRYEISGNYLTFYKNNGDTFGPSFKRAK
jgi:signal peptidase I